MAQNDDDFITHPVPNPDPPDPVTDGDTEPDTNGDVSGAIGAAVGAAGGVGGTDPNLDSDTDQQDPGTEVDPDTGVPDYSGEADQAQGDIDLDYTTPEAEDVETPMSSGTADPTQTEWDVTDEQTVAGQLQELYNRDSPFFEQARQRAIRQHLGSGGQNSAMAAGFGEMAAMDQAFKVAFQDAQTYARSAEFNAAMANQYSLAEQRFIHNAMLSDQAFEQAKSLQTQRITAQLESIVLDYKGRGALMDKELDQFFLKAKQEYAYQVGIIGAQMNATLRVNAMQALSNFYIAGFQSVMDAANNPNLTPEQSAAAMREGMGWFRQQWDYFSQFQQGIGNAASSGSGGQNDFLNYNWMQPGGGANTTAGGNTSMTQNNGYYNWSMFPPNTPGMVDPNTGQMIFGASGDWPTDHLGNPLPYQEAWQTLYGGGAGGDTPYGPYGFGPQGWGFLGGVTTRG